VKYLRSIIGTGTGTAAIVSTAVRHSLWLLVLGAILLAVLTIAVVAAAAFSKRNAPMARLRALVRDLRG
jgi:hypothetical protein